MYIYTALFILLAFVAGLVIGFAMGIDFHWWDRRDR